MLTYNHEKFIGDAIEGVLMQQTDFPFELIVANDHSTDNTEAIVQGFRNKYPDKIKGYNNEKNLGPKFNFIKAFGETAGEYIAICEGDDYWTDPKKLQMQVDFLEKNKQYVFCSHSYRIVNKQKETIFNPNADLEELFESGFEIGIDNYFNRWVTKTLTNVFRRNEVTFDLNSYNILTDTVLFFELLFKGNGYWMDFNGGCYRSHNESLWSSIGVRQRLKISFKVYNELFQKHKNVPALHNALLIKTRQVIDYIMHDANRAEFNLKELVYYSVAYLRISKSKADAKKYLYDEVYKKLKLRSKIRVRKLIDKKYRQSAAQEV